MIRSLLISLGVLACLSACVVIWYFAVVYALPMVIIAVVIVLPTILRFGANEPIPQCVLHQREAARCRSRSA